MEDSLANLERLLQQLRGEFFKVSENIGVGSVEETVKQRREREALKVMQKSMELFEKKFYTFQSVHKTPSGIQKANTSKMSPLLSPDVGRSPMLPNGTTSLQAVLSPPAPNLNYSMGDVEPLYQVERISVKPDDTWESILKQFNETLLSIYRYYSNSAFVVQDKPSLAIQGWRTLCKESCLLGLLSSSTVDTVFACNAQRDESHFINRNVRLARSDEPLASPILAVKSKYKQVRRREAGDVPTDEHHMSEKQFLSSLPILAEYAYGQEVKLHDFMNPLDISHKHATLQPEVVGDNESVTSAFGVFDTPKHFGERQREFDFKLATCTARLLHEHILPFCSREKAAPANEIAPEIDELSMTVFDQYEKELHLAFAAFALEPHADEPILLQTPTDFMRLIFHFRLAGIIPKRELKEIVRKVATHATRIGAPALDYSEFLRALYALANYGYSQKVYRLHYQTPESRVVKLISKIVFFSNPLKLEKVHRRMYHN